VARYKGLSRSDEGQVSTLDLLRKKIILRSIFFRNLKGPVWVLFLYWPQRQRHRGTTGFFDIIDADRTPELFGGVLDLSEIIGKGSVEIDPGISDANHSIALTASRFNVDTFVLGAVHGAVEEVP
jgi:hypothetical protein